MLRANSLDRIHQKRTLRGLYIWHQATPYACFLDTSVVTANVVVVPGMVATKTTGEQVAVSVSDKVPFGLFANFIHGSMDELGGGTEIGVYRGGNDATFEVLAGPAGETPLASITWTTLNTTAGGVKLYSDDSGLLTNVGGSGDYVVARLVEAVSDSKIIITLELGTGATVVA